MAKEVIPEGYPELLKDIKDRVRSAQYAALMAVNKEKLAPLVREIGWTHNILIFERCKDDLQREFYIKMTRKFGWSKRDRIIRA